MKAILSSAAALAAFAAVAGAAPGAPAATDREGEALSALINRELRSDGSWFTPAEQAVIARKCGYRAGEWDGFEARLTGGRFHCTNGRVADDEEMRALIRAAEPRIEARVEQVMARPEVEAAISRVTQAAAAEATRESEARRGR
ncbi:MAG: hypothetical protein ABWX67_01280 [Allosphingosinicella sp.]